jgi:hypothetical protein
MGYSRMWIMFRREGSQAMPVQAACFSCKLCLNQAHVGFLEQLMRWESVYVFLPARCCWLLGLHRFLMCCQFATMSSLRGGGSTHIATLPGPLQITPPPGFGGPISNGATPSVSNHTSVDSISQLGPEAEAARFGARTAAASAAPIAVAGSEPQQPAAAAGAAQESYSPFSAFGGAGGGGSSLFSSLGSSSSLMDRLPSQGDLLAAGSEVSTLCNCSF